MTKFNPKVKGFFSHPNVTVNKEGGLAFKADAKTELTLRFLTWLVGEPKFYESPEETTEIENLIAQVQIEDPEYLMKLASYARNEMYLRSAPIFMLVEGAQYDAVKPYIRKYTPHIIKRADELTETIAQFINKYGEIGERGNASLPNSLKKGIADSFYNFDEYQFAKYDRGGKVKLSDVLRLVHPKPRNDEESALFKRIRENTLTTPETWETVISVNGSTKENWEVIMPKMPYMAKLRNLRNFLKVGADIGPALEHLTNPKAVKNSKQFPFRFYSALKAVNGFEGDPFDKQKINTALENALEMSTTNLPKLKGRTYITCDESGSMTAHISHRSDVTCMDIANIMGALAYHLSDEAIVGMFATNFGLANINPKDAVLTNMEKIRQHGSRLGGGTSAYLALKYIIENKIPVDRVLLFSDMQCYDTQSRMWGGYQNSLAEQWRTYKSSVAPHAKLYSFDLAGYGTLQFPREDKSVILIAGWSDRVLEFISKYEEFGKTQIDTISNYSPFL